jgi:catechol 2,3-dioxygenase-like lactoylglutathione lyase family enzyme
MPITNVIPQLRTTDLGKSIAFYVEVLGFELAFRHSDFYAGVAYGVHTLHLKLVDEPDPSIAYVRDGDHLHLYLETGDATAEAARLKARGVRLRQDVTDTAWGTREFQLLDDQGHVLYIGQRLPARS